MNKNYMGMINLAQEFNNFKGTDKIYRYLDFVKLSDVLLNQRLFFSRTDVQNDKFEGQLGNINVLQQKYMPNQNNSKKHTEKEFRMLQRMFLLSCWHMETIESFAMWKIYAGNNQGVAIETTVDDLMDSIIYSHQEILKSIPSERWDEKIWLSNNIHSGSVYYYNWNDTYIPEQYLWDYRRFLYKLENFEYEKEFRLIIDGQRLLTMLGGDKSNFITVEGFCNRGEYIPIDVRKLVKKIIICPAAGEWFKSLVEKLLLDSGFVDISVEKSCLDRNPSF